MFSAKVFRSLGRQRRELVSASAMAPIALNPVLEGLLTRLERGDLSSGPFISVWRDAFSASRPFLLKSILNAAILAVAVTAGVWLTRSVLLHFEDLGVIATLAFGYLIAELLRHYASYRDMLNRAEMARSIQLTLLTRVAHKLTTIDPLCIGREVSKGNLKTLVSGDIESVEDFISASTQNLLPTVFVVCALTPTVYFLSGWFGLLGIAVSLLQIPIAVACAWLIEWTQKVAQERLDQATTVIGEWIRNIRLVRYLGWQEVVGAEIARFIRSYTAVSVLRKAAACLTYAISFSWWMVSIIVMLWSARISGVPMPVSDLFSSVWALTVVMNWIQFVPWSVGQYGPAKAGVDRLTELMHLPDLERNLRASDVTTVLSAPRAIHLEDLSVSFDRHVVLKNLTLSIDLTKKTAIVGSVGSGKSILLEVLLGEKSPSTGVIEVEWPEGRYNLWDTECYRQYRKTLAWTPQEVFLSNTTVENNITLGAKSVSERIEAAAEKALLLPDIVEWPKRFDQEVGEVGINLSGGQKQRVSLARAFFSDRPIWMLDDPLSAVDRNTERGLAVNIFQSTRGVVIVSHRLDEILRCDRVLVLEAGELIEDGAPQILLAKADSEFKKFVDATRAGESGV